MYWRWFILVVPFTLLQRCAETAVQIKTLRRHGGERLPSSSYPVIIPVQALSPVYIQLANIGHKSTDIMQREHTEQEEKPSTLASPFSLLRVLNETISNPSDSPTTLKPPPSNIHSAGETQPNAAPQSDVIPAVVNSTGSDKLPMRAEKKAKRALDETTEVALDRELKALGNVADTLANIISNQQETQRQTLELEANESAIAAEKQNEENAALQTLENEAQKQLAADKKQMDEKEKEVESEERAEIQQGEAKTARKEEVENAKELIQDARDAAADDVKKNLKTAVEESEKDQMIKTLLEENQNGKELSETADAENIMEDSSSKQVIEDNRKVLAEALVGEAKKQEGVDREIQHRKELETKDEAIAEQQKMLTKLEKTRTLSNIIGHCFEEKEEDNKNDNNTNNNNNNSSIITTTNYSNTIQSPTFTAIHKLHEKDNHKLFHSELKKNGVVKPSNEVAVKHFLRQINKRPLSQEEAEVIDDGSISGEVPAPPPSARNNNDIQLNEPEPQNDEPSNKTGSRTNKSSENNEKASKQAPPTTKIISKHEHVKSSTLTTGQWLYFLGVFPTGIATAVLLLVFLV